MPLLGLGLYKATSEGEAESAIEAAVQNGYRLIDTASAYKNEENLTTIGYIANVHDIMF